MSIIKVHSKVKLKNKMSDEFKFYYKCLKIAGLMSVHYDTTEMCYKIKNNKIYYIYCGFIQVLLIISIIVVSLYKHLYFFNGYNETGNYYNTTIIQLTDVLHILLNLWLLLRQRRHLEILETIRKWNLKYLTKNSSFYTKTRLAFLIMTWITYLTIVFRILCENLYDNFCLNLPWITYSIHLIVSSLISSIYTAILLTITNCLKFVQVSLENLQLQENFTIFMDCIFRNFNIF